MIILCILDCNVRPDGGFAQQQSYLCSEKVVVLRHSLEEVEEKLKEERIKIRHERNKLEKGLPQIPMPANSVPFFKERPEVQKASNIMQVIDPPGTVSQLDLLQLGFKIDVIHVTRKSGFQSREHPVRSSTGQHPHLSRLHYLHAIYVDCNRILMASSPPSSATLTTLRMFSSSSTRTTREKLRV